MRGKGEVMIGCMEGARGEMRGREEGTRGDSTVGQVLKEEGSSASTLRKRGEDAPRERDGGALQLSRTRREAVSRKKCQVQTPPGTWNPRAGESEGGGHRLARE